MEHPGETTIEAVTVYLFAYGLSAILLACLMLIDKGPPRDGMHPYQYGGRRAGEWMRPKLFVLGGAMLVAAAVLWVVGAVLGAG